MATGQLELASLELSAVSRGAAGASLAAARDRLEAAREAAAVGAPPLALYRPPSFGAALEAALADPRKLDRLVDALDLYGGPLLDGETEVWIDAARERLDRRYVDGALALERRSLEVDRPEAALPLVERAHDRRPWSERLALARMRLLAAMGLPSEALDVHRRTLAALRAEHGIEPGSALESLAATIAAGEIS